MALGFPLERFVLSGSYPGAADGRIKVAQTEQHLLQKPARKHNLVLQPKAA
jgi:hypothetical protein